MNRNKLKTYAPAARRSFLQAVKDRATHYGLTAKKIEPMTERGDVVLIAGQPFPKAVAAKRKRLEEHINKVGFERAIEAIAYSWFNRFVAIRFMELHGYLDHGYRVLSHPAGDVQPEILEHAQRVDFPGLDKNKVVELKLDGTKQEELYRLLLVAQCNALSRAMPFLFERIDDETELLLPSNLLATDSLIQKLVREIDEEDWNEVEILGWLYQFYISERKDEVIGKVVASEDIPAATQLFTPNWIVKYLVQNTLGRIWLATYPQSGIRQQMEFYIEPAEQTPEVQEQLKAITPTSLNPETLTLLDPACGSAHILVEAYDLFKAIYQERGYRAKDIPGLILSKNLHGLEIDDRAAQLAAFALLMKARADDRRILESGIQPAILSFVESKGMDASEITYALNAPINKDDLPNKHLLETTKTNGDGLSTTNTLAEKGHVSQGDVASLLELFENAKTFGSLIQVLPQPAATLLEIEKRLDDVLTMGDLTHASAHVLKPLLRQARLLGQKYDAVVANPPYMGTKGLNGSLREFLKANYPTGKADLFAAFCERLCRFTVSGSFTGAMTPFTWMFLGTYEKFRTRVIGQCALQSLVRPEYHAFFESAYVPICAFVLRNTPVYSNGTYIDLTSFYGESLQAPKTLEAIHNAGCPCSHHASQSDFALIPGSPIAYWVTGTLGNVFRNSPALNTIAQPKVGLQTGDNERFLRLWYEVAYSRIGFGCDSRKAADTSGTKWFPCNKGGPFRKWYGNNQYVVNWESDGREMRTLAPSAVIRNPTFYFRTGITWSTVSSSLASFRLSEPGRMFESKGAMCFPNDTNALPLVLGLLNSCVTNELLKIFSPTLDYHEGPMGRLPVAGISGPSTVAVRRNVERAIEISATDETFDETTFSFLANPLAQFRGIRPTIHDGVDCWDRQCSSSRLQMQAIEVDNNRHFIDAYGLQDRLSPEVPDDQITLYCSDREEDIKRLLSYAVGCMMGRYSLDKEGLIYAHSGNEGFDPSQYKKFPADEDGIVPVTEALWFDDDAANRFERFVKTVWPTETLDENLAFVAESLEAKKSEHPRETIRRYFAGDFYKHHLQTYKNRPIYWLFSSGKQGAFEALVYVHRYNEGTLSRMRTEYVVPLLGKMNGRLGMLADVIATATSTKQRKDAEKEKDKLAKQLAEIQAFDERLNHFASQRITLDLDDGVKVNYGKFGDLLAAVKKVCGKAEED